MIKRVDSESLAIAGGPPPGLTELAATTCPKLLSAFPGGAVALERMIVPVKVTGGNGPLGAKMAVTTLGPKPIVRVAEPGANLKLADPGGRAGNFTIYGWLVTAPGALVRVKATAGSRSTVHFPAINGLPWYAAAGCAISPISGASHAFDVSTGRSLWSLLPFAGSRMAITASKNGIARYRESPLSGDARDALVLHHKRLTRSKHGDIFTECSAKNAVGETAGLNAHAGR